MKFKIGDKVKVIASGYTDSRKITEMIGIIKGKIETCELFYAVFFEGFQRGCSCIDNKGKHHCEKGSGLWLREEELKRIDVWIKL